jgi:hypothetical protein
MLVNKKYLRYLIYAFTIVYKVMVVGEPGCQNLRFILY